MRVGDNPNKNQPIQDSDYVHQVIIPVYIPNQEDFFKESFTILTNCLDSLFKTCHAKTYFTVVNNGSCKEIADYLDQLLKDKKIHELIHTSAIGKLNSILKGLAGHTIKLVTITDSDVLFLNNWQSETVAVFNSFPKTGVVGIVPQFKMFVSNCGNVILENLFSSNLKFTTVKNPNALIRFYDSIWEIKVYNTDYLKLSLSITSKNNTALVGSCHFVATYRKELFDEIVTYIGFKMGASSEGYLDDAPLKKGYWRLTTEDNHAYHMGNRTELWMQQEIEQLTNDNYEHCKLIATKILPNKSRLNLIVKNKLFPKLFSSKRVKNIFYRLKKLPKSMIKEY